jgi:hypothetical protein
MTKEDDSDRRTESCSASLTPCTLLSRSYTRTAATTRLHIKRIDRTKHNAVYVIKEKRGNSASL